MKSTTHDETSLDSALCWQLRRCWSVPLLAPATMTPSEPAENEVEDELDEVEKEVDEELGG